ncbi:MAG: D-aminoacyl-tRNA deacylase [Candidatus Latescibacterota bacterium]|nr:D-aminoacyl-tRNA deacylase [Candidatus Latescibacterota bacterium]
MKILLQRVDKASVYVDEKVVGQIGFGMVLFVGIHRDDDIEILKYCAEKCINLRLFSDENGEMNASVLQVGGQVLAVSQFTLYGDCRRGRRPSFDQAARADVAKPLYSRFLNILEFMGARVESGVFGADMKVEIHNNGPVTLCVEHSN